MLYPGGTVDCISHLEASMEASGSMKACPHGGDNQASSRFGTSLPYISNTDLPSTSGSVGVAKENNNKLHVFL